MNVSFRQLRLFLALADSGSVTAAARAMHVTQPTASMQLREVADAVGLPLYEVISRKVHLTQAGRELAATARAMMAEWDTFGQTVNAMKGLRRGRLKVAVVSTAEYFIPRLLGRFCDEHPEVDVALQILNRDGVVARLRDNLDDLYVMSMPPADMDLIDQVLMPNPLALVAPARHPLAGRKGLTLADLQGERFILRERGSGTRMAVDAHCQAVGFIPRVRLELGSNEAIKEAVAANLGLSVLSVHSLHDAHAANGLARLDVAGFPIGSQWHIVRPRGKRHTPIAEVFEAHLLAQAHHPAPVLERA